MKWNAVVQHWIRQPHGDRIRLVHWKCIMSLLWH